MREVTTVRVRCILCGVQRDEGPNSNPDYVPVCEQPVCGGVMVAVTVLASVRTRRMKARMKK